VEGAGTGAGFASISRARTCGAQAGRDAAGLIAAARWKGQVDCRTQPTERGLAPRQDYSVSGWACSLKTLVPHDAMAVYCPKDDVLAAEFVAVITSGCSLHCQIPPGEGLSGWGGAESQGDSGTVIRRSSPDI